MEIVLIGPCMLLAPLVFLLALLALPLWPVVLILLGAVWLVLWPVEQVATRLGATWLTGKSAAVGRAFMVVLRPWRAIREAQNHPH